jgi:hypothetical protein
MSKIYWNTVDSENLLTVLVAESTSLAEVIKKLGLVPAGGNYRSLKHHISRLDLSISHFTGKGWNKDNFKNRDYSTNNNRKKYLIRQRGHQCEQCHNTLWQGSPIPLELEHCDGNTENNVEANLKLLCCNCHALTPTWRRPKKLVD